MLSTVPLLAAVSISVVPFDGTNEVRLKQGFSDINIVKNVRVRVTSTDASRYQVFQRVMEPLVNEKGEVGDLSGLQTITEYNSNTGGTLYLQSAEPLSMADQLLYTSGTSGDSDSFAVAYSTMSQKRNAGGNFRSNILYFVRSNDGAQSQQMLNLFLESQRSALSAEVRGLKADSRIIVKDSDSDLQAADGVRISFTGGTGNNVRIYQEVAVIPQNQQAEELKAGVLKFVASGNEELISGMMTQGIVRNSQRDMIFSGRVSQGELDIKFMPVLENILEQNAGTYTGQLKYTVESDSNRQEFSVYVEFQMQPVFTIEASMPPEGVSFKNVSVTNQPEDHEISVAVKTNLHKPYSVTQAMLAPLTNEKGNQLDNNHFLIKVVLPQGQKGKTKFTEFSPLAVGEYPIYVSDGQGSPAAFKVQYRLESYSQMNAGNFLAPMRFSLDQN